MSPESQNETAPPVLSARRGRDADIVIVGAGPAGLSAAYFLKKNGYRNVTVIEKLGRVGGLCFSVTEDYTCFDLGANYLTPDYRETLRLSKEFDVEHYAERNVVVAEIDPQKPGYKARSPWDSARGQTPIFTFLRACVRYVWLRWKLRRIIDPPGHAGMAAHADLCVPFQTWLDRNDLGSLSRLFQMPITIMGYGFLHEIPAPYALKYIPPRTFIAMCIKAFPLTSWWPWPRRFCLGFQWLWSNVARELNVWTNIDVEWIRRSNDRCRIRYVHREQNLNTIRTEADEFNFDYLILACPLSSDVMTALGLELSDEERELLAQIVTAPYCMTSLKVRLPNLPSDFAMATIPLTPIGTPWAITKQADDSNLIQFYSRLDSNDLRGEGPTRLAVKVAVNELITRLGGSVDEVDDDIWHSFDRWPYFKHVTAEAIRGGFYDRLEALQGRQKTYYAGGLLDFELVERIIRYSKQLVDDNFPPAGPRAEG